MTVICSSSIALIIKQNSEKKGNPLVLLAGNYLIAALISGLLFLTKEKIEFSFFTFLFGTGMGALFLFSFFAFTAAVETAGTALATVSSRISVVVPVIFSIILFNEIPTMFHLTGIIFAIITIIFFYFSLRTIKEKILSVRDYFFLFIVLIGIGVCDFGMKVFQYLSERNEEAFFLLIVFSFAFIYAVIVIKAKKIRFDKSSMTRGGLLGIPNIFSSYFLLGALGELPGIIVYPAANIGIILLTTFSAWLIWKESINRFGKLALISGAVAIFFLSL
jgi:drug/metabolite transporter (DMT)-like permease